MLHSFVLVNMLAKSIFPSDVVTLLFSSTHLITGDLCAIIVILYIVITNGLCSQFYTRIHRQLLIMSPKSKGADLMLWWLLLLLPYDVLCAVFIYYHIVCLFEWPCLYISAWLLSPSYSIMAYIRRGLHYPIPRFCFINPC